ncbi:hypothetical protein Tco_1283056 [Tanacetum coccineum]
MQTQMNNLATSNQRLESMLAITTRSGLVLDGPSVPIPPPFINPEEDEREEEILTDQERRPEECYDLIENMTAHHNDWDTSTQRNESSSSNTSSNPKIASLKLQIEEMNRNFTRMLQTNQQAKPLSLPSRSHLLPSNKLNL